MRISDPKIDEIRSSSDIIEVVSGYVQLKKRGKNYIGLCPFHQEKSPSFTVSPEKQMYHCFGCGVGGNVITFVMEIEKVSFVEALRTLAERAGITLYEAQSGRDEDRTEHEKLYQACRRAGLHFHQNLTATTEGKAALEYFRSRGFSDEAIRKFGLGYSLNSWDDLLKLGQREGIDVLILEKAGLAVKRDDGTGYYDRFRGRAMFPIFSPAGRVIGFGARKLREDDPLGKYINSPETPIYDKSRALYGLFQSKDAIRQKEFAVLVEGYADLISLFQAGVENVVASSGTALTEEQIRIIGRYARHVTLVYDADSAGSKATMRGVDLIIEHGLEVRVVQLPEGEDPDSFVQKYGRSAFEDLLNGAVSFLDFKVSRFQALGLLKTPEGMTKAVRSIMQTIAGMNDELKQHFYIKHLAATYAIDEGVLFRELEKQPGRRAGKGTRIERPVSKTIEKPVGESGFHDLLHDMPAVERDLLKLMLEHGSPIVRVVLENVAPEHLTHAVGRNLLDRLARITHEGKDWTVSTLVNEMSDESMKKLVASLVFNKYEISKGWAEMDSEPEEIDPRVLASRLVSTLLSEQIDRLIRENQQRLKEASARGEPVRAYVEKHQELLRERQQLTPATH